MKSNLRIRKLIPLECMKLMGFSKKQYNDISNFNDSAIYHVSGDSIVVTCLMALFGELTDLDYRKIINDYIEKEIIEIGSRTI